MPATIFDIRSWVERRPPEATHMIVKCDTFDYRGDPGDQCCYPVYVTPDEDVREKEQENRDRTMEVYSFTGKHSIASQLNSGRVHNYD
jgi:hypothetical protein